MNKNQIDNYKKQIYIYIKKQKNVTVSDISKSFSIEIQEAEFIVSLLCKNKLLTKKVTYSVA